MTVLSVAYIAGDVFRDMPENTAIMWAWVLTSINMGPVALTLCVLADAEVTQEPIPPGETLT